MTDTTKPDIKTLDDIKKLVDTFYGRVQEDGLIGPIFNEKLAGKWPEHLAKMYAFWQTILLDEHTYHGRPFPPHAELPIHQEHFERWLALFGDTVDRLFEGETASEAKARGQKMAALFQVKLEHVRQSPFKALL